MNKYITKITFLALISLGFVACNSEDFGDCKEQTTFHDKKGNYVPITIEADYGAYEEFGEEISSRVNPSTYIAPELLRSLTAKWTTVDKLIVIFDGAKSELTYKSGVNTANGVFQGNLYYTSAKLPTTAKLHIYVKSDYINVDSDSPTSFEMVDIESQAGTLSDAFKRTVWYGTDTYKNIITSQKSVTLNPQTAILNFKLRGPLVATGTSLSYSVAKLIIKGKGWGNGDDLVEFEGKIGNEYKQYCYCINTKNTISEEKIVATYNDKIYERLIGDESKEIRLLPGKIYNKPGDHGNLEDSPTLRVGDFLYSDGGWGDAPTPESGHKIIGIVTSKKSNFGTYDNQESYHGTAMAVRYASSSSAFSSAAPSTVSYTGTYSSESAARSASGLTLCQNMLKKSTTIFTAVNLCKNFSSTVTKPSGCSDWYLPSCAEWADAINNIGKKGTYAYTNLSSTNRTWAGTEWEELTWTANNDCPTAAFYAINEFINRAKSSAGTVNNFVYNSGFWAADYQGASAFTRVSMGGSIGHPYMDARTHSYTHQVRPFIQF